MNHELLALAFVGMVVATILSLAGSLARRRLLRAQHGLGAVTVVATVHPSSEDTTDPPSACPPRSERPTRSTSL